LQVADRRRGAQIGGAALQEKLARLGAEAASLRTRFNAADKRRLQEDHRARKSRLDQAILFIGRTIGELYEGRTGEFVVDATRSCMRS
jgi:hypothetical protein